LHKGMMRFNINCTAGAQNIGSDCLHVAKIVKNVESIVAQAEAVDALEVYTKCVVRFGFGEFRSPGVVMSKVVGFYFGRSP
jgi:hypothetical protein